MEMSEVFLRGAEHIWPTSVKARSADIGARKSTAVPNGESTVRAAQHLLTIIYY